MQFLLLRQISAINDIPVWKHHSVYFLSYGSLGIFLHIPVTNNMITIHKDNLSFCHLLSGLQQNTVKLGTILLDLFTINSPICSALSKDIRSVPPSLWWFSTELSISVWRFFGPHPRVRQSLQVAILAQCMTILILKSNRSVHCAAKICVYKACSLSGTKAKKPIKK